MAAQILYLFPPYLNRPQGDSNSAGAAVLFLKQLLFSIAGYCGLDVSKLTLTDNYDEELAQVIEDLQDALEIERDGNFGPATRECLVEELHIDVSKIRCTPNDLTFWIGPGSDRIQTWPIAA